MHESGENYLETILILQNKNGSVRSIDIANELGFSKPSISRAMGILKDSRLISIDGNGHIAFTTEGKKKAESIYERHQLLLRFFKDVLGVDKETADADACRIEHVISQQSFDKIKEQVEKINK